MNRRFILFVAALMVTSVTMSQNDSKTKKTNQNDPDKQKSETVDSIDHFLRLNQICNYIEENYVETPDYLKITEHAASSMLAELDPHSTYIAAKDVQRVNEGLQANFEGVGIAFQIVDDTISVTEVIAGGPSEKVGVQIGDKLLKVDDTVATFKGVNQKFVFNHLRGKRGTEVVLTVKRTGTAEPIVFNIVRDKIPIYSVETSFMIDDEVGYIRLARFARTSRDEVHDAIRKLKKSGMKRLVFDLRGNGGGYLDIAHGVATEFLKHGSLVVYTEGMRSPRRNLAAGRGGEFTAGPLVILIDENSASASEIVSGAVQDWDRGVIVGRRSFGKGLVQRMFEIYDGAQIRLTTARYYTPSGRCIQKPYDDGTDAYHQELLKRYEHHEMSTADSIEFPDSLRFYTVNGRVVYGGGGIMPDVFVPMDTMRLSDYYLSLRSSGVFNTFALNWADQHRSDPRFASFDDFINNYDSLSVAREFEAFALSKNIRRQDVKGEWVAAWMNDLAKKQVSDTNYAIHADNYVEYMGKLMSDEHFVSQLKEKAQNEDRRSQSINRHSDVYMGYILKSMIARNLFGNEYYYRVMKDFDEGLLQAIKTVKDIQQ